MKHQITHPHPPGVASLVAPSLDPSVTPCAQRVLDSAILVEESIPHGVVPLGRPRITVPVPRGRNSIVRVLGIEDVFISPLFGDIAIVVFQV